MTLTELSYYSRKMLPFAIIAFLLLMILFYSFKLFFIYLNNNNQSVPQSVINPVFDKINGPGVRNATTSAGFNFTLDTIEGEPVTASDAAKVFFIPTNFSQFHFREKITLMAKTIGFNTEVVNYQLASNEATFDDGRQKMTVDITDFNFKYEYDLKNLNSGGDFFASGEAALPTNNEIENQAIEFYNSVGRYPAELAQGRRNLVYFQYQPDTNTMVMLNNSTGANLVEVDFYRANIDDIPIVSPKFYNSQHYVLIAYGKNASKVIRAQLKFYERSTDQVGIYPIKTGDIAWKELTSGRGYVVNQGVATDNVIIKKMFYGYLDPDYYQPYLQTVYVFIGDGDYVAYVPALDKNYLTE